MKATEFVVGFGVGEGLEGGKFLLEVLVVGLEGC